MPSFLKKTLAQIVSDDYRTAAVFEKHQLDFCCRGKRSLEQACVEKQLNTNEVIADLEHATLRLQTAGSIVETLPPSALADYIVEQHHQYVRTEMPLIASYLQKIADRHGDRHPELIRIAAVFNELKAELELHLQKEEQVLFPRIKTAEKCLEEESGSHSNRSFLEAPVTVMEHEHDDAGEAMATIRRLTNHYSLPADACTTYQLAFAALEAFEKDLHRHVHLENNILFPKAMQLFRSDPELA